MIFSKTYESITKKLRLMVEDLHSHALLRTQHAEDHRQAMLKHDDLAEDAMNDADRARKTAIKIHELIG